MGNAKEYIKAKIESVGLVDPNGLQGVVILSSENGNRLPISAFSGEVAQHIKRFIDGDRTSLPTIYKMIEELSEYQSLLLTKIEIYGRESVLRANIYFKGREKDLILRNYRASDAIALAAFYDTDIMIQEEILSMDDMQ